MSRYPALSQGTLQRLQDCPRLFQVEALELSSRWFQHDLRQRLDWGRRFHRLMQQQALGIAIEQMQTGDRSLDQCLADFAEAQPQLFVPPPAGWHRQTECRWQWPFQDFVLVAIFDRLELSDRAAQIHDWKTHNRPQTLETLAASWQTQLYCWLVTERSGLPPESVAMHYWFVLSQPQKPVTIHWNRQQHQQTQQRLERSLQELKGWLQDYPQTPLPQRPDRNERCQTCEERDRCWPPTPSAAAIASWDEIPVVEL
ncbi:PD-(D/E)XK nuclease family protein [Synechococcus elongatus]|uniref:PD-(D/E)XK nuclease family protein n=1 Tax=Synechococcus elongatus PCC 11801 TaxID=2219813 RepID=A0AAN1QMX1_SYNEL|nr:PD-(D/E)XK nuclease family protein [Synechococcus elongatus]AZB72111.1 PD-(D/E)XK nuclease family protein [Synechococcus elongatus PCC 11801]